MKLLISLLGFSLIGLSLFAQKSDAVISVQGSTRNILFEEFTGTWCGCCPRGHVRLKKILEDHYNVIPVMIHSGDDDEPMHIVDGDQLAFDLDAWFPSATIDRLKFPDNDFAQLADSDWEDMILSRLEHSPFADVLLEKSYDSESGSLTVTVTVIFITGGKGDFRFNAYLLEDNLIHNQENSMNDDISYPDLFGRGDPILGYVHDHVLRKMLGGPYGINPGGGDGIPLNVTPGQTYSYTFSTFLNVNFKLENIHLVGYVMEYDGPHDSEVLNAATMQLIETSVRYVSEGNLLKVYPNPNNGEFNIIYETVKPEVVTIVVRNLQSQNLYQQVWSKNAGKGFISLKLDDLPIGIYFLELASGGRLSYQKIVVGR